MSRFAFFVAAFALMSVSVLSVNSASADQGQSATVFGQSLMSSAEIAAHKDRLADCQSAQERKEVEAAHKDRMVQRARWKGQVIRTDTMTMADNN